MRYREKQLEVLKPSSVNWDTLIVLGTAIAVPGGHQPIVWQNTADRRRECVEGSELAGLARSIIIVHTQHSASGVCVVSACAPADEADLDFGTWCKTLF